jgi:hypothetical protein
MSLGSIAGGTSQALSVLPVTGRDLAAADSANYYVAVTPTPGTGIITGTPTTLVETTPALVVFNGGLLNVYLTYLRLGTTVAGVGDVTFMNFSHSLDQGNRMGAATNGTALTINNTNIMSNTKSSVQATFGAITGAGAKTANQRIIGNDWFRGNFINIIGDVYEFQYGAPSGVGVGSTPATVINCVRSAPAVCLQPQSSYVLNIWCITTFTTGITMEVQLGFIEK